MATRVPFSPREQARYLGLSSYQWGSCIEVHTTAAGTDRVDASVGARTWTTTIEVRGTMAKPRPGLIETMTGPVEGDRATLTHAD